MSDYYRTRLDSESHIVIRKNSCAGDSQYRRDGFAILRGVLPVVEIPRSVFALPCVMEPNGQAVRSVLDVHTVMEICKHPELSRCARKILGDQFYIFQSRINFKYPRISSGWSWHSDFETWHAQDGMPEPRCFSAMIPLTSNNMSNGPLMVLPGSHEWYWSAPAPNQTYTAEENFADQKEGVPSDTDLMELAMRCGTRPVPILCEPGDLILFDCNLLHGSKSNVSDKARSNLYFVFNDSRNKLQEPYSTAVRRPEYMAHRE